MLEELLVVIQMRVIDRQGKDFTEYFHRRLFNDFEKTFNAINGYWDEVTDSKSIDDVSVRSVDDRIYRHLGFAGIIKDIGSWPDNYERVYNEFFKSISHLEDFCTFLSGNFYVCARKYIEESKRKYSLQLEFNFEMPPRGVEPRIQPFYDFSPQGRVIST